MTIKKFFLVNFMKLNRTEYNYTCQSYEALIKIGKKKLIFS